ncbi:MAG: hypothetical protein RLZ07_638 [Pseudomonadota bacterium]|jgi:uncharacterized FlaG/YvyC family protein
MTSTAILSSLNRVPVADTETGVPRFQNAKTETQAKGDDKDAPSKPSSSAEAKPSPNATVRRTTIDWETGSVVFRVIDEHSGQTVSQSPEEALLRLRAYARQNETTSESGTEQQLPPSPRTEKKV